jgi:probable rRNA maturation factor
MGKASITITARAGREMVPYLRRHLPRLLPAAAPHIRELSVVLVGDRAISQLHQRFFNDPSTTDVITFPLDTDAKGRCVSGELYLCVAMARRQARARGLAPQRELLLYGLHGMLHLAGYDDLSDAEYDKMHLKEDELLRKLRIGATFACPRRRGGEREV